MGFETETPRTFDKTSALAKLKLEPPGGARILILCGDEDLTQHLNSGLLEAGFVSECASTITAGCEFVKSGRFQVVVTTPILSDGSWRRLVDFGSHYGLGFVVVLVGGKFDFNQRAEALESGAFDVLDSLHEVPKTAETLKRALWAAYLKGAGPTSEAACPLRAA